MASCAFPCAITAERIWNPNLTQRSLFWDEPTTRGQIKDIKLDDEDSKILDFSRLETDILRNVLDEEGERTEPNRCENVMENFPSFNYVPIPIPHTFTKLNPILKLCSIESMRSPISMHDHQVRDVQNMVRKNLNKTQCMVGSPEQQQHASSAARANELLKQLTLPKMVPTSSVSNYNSSLIHILGNAHLPKIDDTAANNVQAAAETQKATLGSPYQQLLENRSPGSHGGSVEPTYAIGAATPSVLRQAALRPNGKTPYMPRAKPSYLDPTALTTQVPQACPKQKLTPIPKHILIPRVQGHRFAGNGNQHCGDSDSSRGNAGFKRRLAPRLAAKHNQKYKSPVVSKPEAKTFAQIVAETRPEANARN
ncbi:uncharacterized protein LOC100178856 [Ciona intestinalis]